MSLITILKLNRKNIFLKSFSYAVSGFSLIFIGYLLFETLLHYPPRMIGISP
jgi:hypothetical protein